jgi:hypothetical protein
MVTSVTFQLPAAGTTLAVDTKHTELPVVVQTSLGADVSRGAPYLRDGRVFVDFTSRAATPRALTVLFARRWETP